MVFGFCDLANQFQAKGRVCLFSFLGVFIDQFHWVTLGKSTISPSVLSLCKVILCPYPFRSCSRDDFVQIPLEVGSPDLRPTAQQGCVFCTQL